jgi:hypothetical protein
LDLGFLRCGGGRGCGNPLRRRRFLSWIIGRGSLDAAANIVRWQGRFGLDLVVLGRGLGLRRRRQRAAAAGCGGGTSYGSNGF